MRSILLVVMMAGLIAPGMAAPALGAQLIIRGSCFCDATCRRSSDICREHVGVF